MAQLSVVTERNGSQLTVTVSSPVAPTLTLKEDSTMNTISPTSVSGNVWIYTIDPDKSYTLTVIAGPKQQVVAIGSSPGDGPALRPASFFAEQTRSSKEEFRFTIEKGLEDKYEVVAQFITKPTK